VVLVHTFLQVGNSRLSSVDLNPTSSSSSSVLPAVSSEVLQQRQDSLERAAGRVDDNQTGSQSQTVANRIGNI